MNNKLIYKFLFLSFNVLLSSKFSIAQDVKVNAIINKKDVLIGDAIELKLTVEYNPTKYKIEFPIIQDTFNHFEIVDKSKKDTSIKREVSIFTQKTIITNFDSGRWVIPSMKFDILPLNGSSPTTINTDSILVNVNTVAVDTSKAFMPIMANRKAKMPMKILLMYIAGAVLLATILFFLIWYFIKTLREKNNKPKLIETTVKLPPHEKAMRSLLELEKQNLWQNGQEKTYHTLLTDTIRTYLEEQFNMDCFEKTSSELMQQIKKQKSLSTSRQSLRTIFETADLVKFAKNKPSEDEHLNSMELAKEVILESHKKYLNSIVSDISIDKK